MEKQILILKQTWNFNEFVIEKAKKHLMENNGKPK